MLEIYKELPKFVKWCIWVFIIILCLGGITLIPYAVFSAYSGKPISAAGASLNQENLKKDIKSPKNDSLNTKEIEIKPKQNTTYSSNVYNKDNSHVVSGNNNQVGINGDVNINPKQRLEKADKAYILNNIKQLREKDKNLCNGVEFSYKEENQFVQDIRDYLKSIKLAIVLDEMKNFITKEPFRILVHGKGPDYIDNAGSGGGVSFVRPDDTSHFIIISVGVLNN